jgi:DNA repair protein SbcC/Rad50
MRPLELAVEGFTSFRDPQVIDFRPLGLFVITGPTGAGKTSILDALTLALYGEVARAGRGEIRSLISTGQNAARVRLDFQVEGVSYRVVRRFPRNGSQAVSLERIEGDRLIPEVESGKVKEIRQRIQALVGLDFEAFTRAVLLPQGDFSRFLRGSPDQRKDILERLLDLGRYKAAGKRAGIVAREYRGRADTLEEDLERRAGEVTPEALEALQEEESRALEAATRLEGVEREGAALVEEIRGLDQRREALDDLEGRLMEGAQGWMALQEQRRRGEPRREELESRRGELGTRLAGAREREEGARKALERVRLECGTEVELARLERGVEDRAGIGALLAEARGKLGEARSSMAALEGEREGLMAREEELARGDSAAREGVDAARVAVQEARVRLQRAREVAERRRELEEARAGAAAAEGELAAVEAREEEARDRLDRARQGLERLQQAHIAAGLRVHLVAGEPCPVCEQVVAGLPGESDATTDALEAARAACREGEEAWTRLDGQLRGARSAVAGAVARVETLERGLSGDGDVPEPEAAQALLSAAEDGARKALELGRERGEALARNREELQRIAGTLQEREKLIANLDQAIAREERRQVEVEELLEGAFPEGLPEDVAGAVRERQARLSGAEASARSARTVLDATREEEEALRREEESFREELTRLESRAGTLQGRMRELQAAAERLGVEAPEEGDAGGGDDPGNAMGALVSAVGVTNVRLMAERSGALERLRGLARSHLPEGAEGVGSLEPRGVHALLSRARQEARDLVVRTAEAVRTTRQALEQVAETRSEIATLRRTAELHHQLWVDLNARNFLDFLLQESIQDLAGAASGELNRVSNGRYSLTSQGTDFMVVDHNNADETRSVVTLSGGETFLASLSLALSLAGAVRDLAGTAAAARLETILIDEGFGALDQATLDVAIEALERLQQDQRMVGIITHVQELADRIPSGLEVVPGVAGAGSRVVVRGVA